MPELPQVPAARTHRVRVTEVVAETADARSFVLAPADGVLAYRPGQFLTLRLPGPDGGAAARCYSLASSPHSGEPMKITVKRVAGGHGSNWLCDHIGVGDELEVLAPAGTFGSGPLDGDLLLAAAGSGITPVISLAKAALAGSQGRVVLLYANRDESAVIFRDELRALAAAHPRRLLVLHWLETLDGLPSADRLTALLGPYAGHRAYLCGPAPFMDAVDEALRAAGAAPAAIHRERFFSLTGDVFRTSPAAAAQPAAGGAASRAVVELDGETHDVTWGATTPLLDALLAAGIDAPYSCREGSCAACACRVVEGEVTVVHDDVLDDEDRADGYVLACQALPASERISISYS
ncbi:2Fe-2S iron-sulfur cluster-binding protein [Streptomyces sp. NBC_00859]|uniref:2Fe-2S iron-sulfur cluster-binding protein n=1 Tax=Streptomyces sp. NBC_00859 TaxID=2903682 RepID=UPI0038633CD8|nr:ferredoxin--NADP reductase [Streptomyces sp. NBC_00859]